MICGIFKKETEKLEINFSEHINKTHNLWNYLSFIYYLLHSEENDLFCQEVEIKHKIKKNDYSWIPDMKTGTINIEKMKLNIFINKGLKNGNSERILRQFIEKSNELVNLVESKQKIPPEELVI